jgi:hypothetical protein
MIRTQMGTHNRPEMVAVQGMPCVIRLRSVTVTIWCNNALKDKFKGGNFINFYTCLPEEN